MDTFIPANAGKHICPNKDPHTNWITPADAGIGYENYCNYHNI